MYTTRIRISRLSLGRASRKRSLVVHRGHDAAQAAPPLLLPITHLDPCSSRKQHSYSSLASSSSSPPLHYSSLKGFLAFSLFDPSTTQQQVRWKRHDGHKASTRHQSQRPPTKKQRKAYNKSLQAKYGNSFADSSTGATNGQQQQQKRIPGQHGAPGSRAGPRREYYEAMKRDWRNEESASALVTSSDGGDEGDDEYSMNDALLEDLMGNTQNLSSQPTPRPMYLGNSLTKYRDVVLRQMDMYKQQQLRLQEDASKNVDGDFQTTSSSLELQSNSNNSSQLLPSDVAISRAIRAFRDKHGTRQKPVGIVRAIAFILQDLEVPLEALDEYSYTSLLTCCRTLQEGRRILQLMQQEGVAVSAYSWSILVDIHAKVGGYEGCAKIMEEMLAEGVTPVLATYTSFLAACYKVCSDGRVAHKVRSKAAKESWEKWQEMRVVGVDPDVMAYGAILRICATQGHAERAINVLEEMQQMEVKPTTLCFSSALRAVAKSQAIAIRYENGSSKRNRRREFLASHHGKMAQSIVRMAESAQVEQDNGFVAALIMCAANVGDVATAKAVYVASEIRKLDQFRSIGPDRHLEQLRGEADQRLLMSGNDSLDKSLSPSYSTPSEMTIHSNKVSFEEREYGKDSRVLSAIMHACANAVDRNGIGTLWQGRENKGYLCDDSLRLLTAQKIPNYVDNSIPYQSTTDDLTWEGEHRDDGYRDGKRTKRAFKGVEEQEGSTLDELDDMYAKIYLDDEGELKDEFRKTTPEDIWRMKYQDKESRDLLDTVAGRFVPEERILLSSSNSVGNNKSEAVDMYFDYDSMRWKHGEARSLLEDEGTSQATRSSDQTVVEQGDAKDQSGEGELYFDYDTMRWQTRSIADAVSADQSVAECPQLAQDDSSDTNGDNAEAEDLYFDIDSMRWQSRPSEEKTTASPIRTAFESKVLQSDKKTGDDQDTSNAPLFDEAEFAKFYEDLRAEIVESGEDVGQVDEEEARELFAMTKAEYEEIMNMNLDELADLGLVGAKDMKRLENAKVTTTVENSDSEDFESVGRETIDEFGDEVSYPIGDRADLPAVLPSALTRTLNTGGDGSAFTADSITQPSSITNLASLSQSGFTNRQLAEMTATREMAVFDETITDSYSLDHIDEFETSDLEELRSILPAFSDRRISRILTVFKQNLEDPPLLDLVPLVREKMPDFVTATWLKQMSSLTARYVVQKAGQDGLIDIHMINGALELETRSGSLNRAVDFFETEYSRHGIVPNEYSNRLLLQMFLDNNRFSRALAFKHRLNDAGAKLDIISYGSLVDHCGRHGQVGSAMLLLKECLAVHGAVPGEASLSRLRALGRKNGFEKELTAMAGPDPVEWLRHGEAKLKREYSKKGRRDVQFARNRLVHL